LCFGGLADPVMIIFRNRIPHRTEGGTSSVLYGKGGRLRHGRIVQSFSVLYGKKLPRIKKYAGLSVPLMYRSGRGEPNCSYTVKSLSSSSFKVAKFSNAL